ncbi:iron dependent repressor, metal binding and dimerization domain protein [Cryobacterium sp. Sr8]|uniref:iron dependent repressor, metal binding and dimerization domain protein n=1 Tax=Cryobacterium sp. Sr8 TaxID=1259203 RepID=UPI00141AB607|nr:iron dependent repressor, metal binding and dimerization domain protein [Cryobacterium sp. Sr8]
MAPSRRLELAGRTPTGGTAHRRRLLETFLIQTLGYSGADARLEAENLEHAVSDSMIKRIDDHLGNLTLEALGLRPTGGQQVRPVPTQLTHAESGPELSISHISDAHPAVLSYFTRIGLVADTRLIVQPHRLNSDIVTIRMLGHTEDVHLGNVASDAVWVTSIEMT